MAKINFLSVKDSVPASGYWDQAFLIDILNDIPDTDREVFVIPGAYQWDVLSEINKKLSEHNKVIVFITSDEEGKFNVNELKHPDMIVYSQYGNGGHMLPLGYTSETRKTLKEIGLQEKTLNYFFSGQINHIRRIMLHNTIEYLPDGETVFTNGFAQGLGQKEYLTKMAQAKTVPCPPGHVAIDSFRLYEALEAGAIPITDNIHPLKSYNEHYWKRLFGDVMFPTFANYPDLPDLIDRASRFKNYSNKTYAWWISKKHQIKEKIKRHMGVPKDEMVAVVPVSPIKSHPSTDILEETLNSIRAHTDCPIIITFDGVREEEEFRRADYEEFQRRMLWKINFEYNNIIPVIFDKHNHQSGMMKVVLQQIETPMILYVEQDTPLTPDRKIEWDKCKDYIRSGSANVIRFHFEESVPEPHEHMMIGEPENGFLKTVQWSQRPHLASLEMYSIIMELFSDESNCFIEDYVHGVLHNLYLSEGYEGWSKWRVFIYHPEGGIKRSYHTDGRAGEKKFDDRQTW